MSEPLATDALRRLCEGAVQRPEVETTDSWFQHQGIPLRDQAVQALRADPEIGPHLKPDMFLHVPLGAGVGFGAPEFLVQGFLRAVVQRPASEWDGEIERFLDVLRLRDDQAPCTVKLGLSGLSVQNSPLELTDAVLRNPGPQDFFTADEVAAPVSSIFEYRTFIPAQIGGSVSRFEVMLLLQVEGEHRHRATRLLVALALESPAPVQEQMVHRAVDFVGAGGGRQPAPIAPLPSPPTVVDDPTAERIATCYEQLAGADLSGVAVAARRLLLARTERVRPEDQIIDYAIALESMTQEWGGKAQGKELSRLLGQHGVPEEEVERQHKSFRKARKAVVHEGIVPTHVKVHAETGRRLVEQSLRARVGLGLASAQS